MKKSMLSALALAASLGLAGSAWADVLFAVGAPLIGHATWHAYRDLIER